MICLNAHSAWAGDKAKAAVEQQLTLPGPVGFETGSDRLAAASESALEHVADYLAKNKKVTKLRIEVHSDARGSAGYNMKMSKQRAASVARWLIGKGVSCRRLLPVGFGESKPLVSPERTPQDRARNRRVDFFIARVKGKKSKHPMDGGGEIASDPCKTQ